MKPLPFRAWRKKYVPLVIDKDEKGKTKSITGNYYISSNWESILKILKMQSKSKDGFTQGTYKRTTGSVKFFVSGVSLRDADSA